MASGLQQACEKHTARRSRLGEDHLKYRVSSVDTTIIVATLWNDHHFALRPELFIDVFALKFFRTHDRENEIGDQSE